MLYKVVSDSVTVDDVVFEKDAILDLEAATLNVADLLAEGSIIETTEDEELGDAPEPTDPLADEPASRGLYFDGKKLAGKITELEENGVVYKCFATEDGATFKLPVEEFALKVGEKGL